jgi:DNA-binding CsgD family transcriptional regulator
MQMATPAPEAIRREIVRLAQVGLDRRDFIPAAAGVLRRAIPFDGVAVVWFDPATALPVDRWIDTAGSRLADIDLHEADIEEFRRLAGSASRATGKGRVLRAVCVGDAGLWGAIEMRRELGAPTFDERDVDLLASLSRGFEDVYRERLQRDLSADPGNRDRGLLLLDDEDGIEMADAAAAAWLDELRDDGRRLPVAVAAVAERARAIDSGHTDAAATARVRTASGRWLLVRGSVLHNGTRVRAAVSLEAARAPELAELVADAHGLTARERHVTKLVAQGLTSAAIATRLHLSAYTVQDHLKAVFEKLAVSSRGELVARLFVDHHQLDASLGRP